MFNFFIFSSFCFLNSNRFTCSCPCFLCSLYSFSCVFEYSFHVTPIPFTVPFFSFFSTFI
eukprot:UN18307